MSLASSCSPGSPSGQCAGQPRIRPLLGARRRRRRQKYTTLAYLAPLGLWALARARKSGVRQVLLLAGGAITASFFPWMARAWIRWEILLSVPVAMDSDARLSARSGKVRVVCLAPRAAGTYDRLISPRVISRIFGKSGARLLGVLLLRWPPLSSHVRRSPVRSAASAGAIFL